MPETALAERLAELERENARLRARLEHALKGLAGGERQSTPWVMAALGACLGFPERGLAAGALWELVSAVAYVWPRALKGTAGDCPHPRCASCTVVRSLRLLVPGIDLTPKELKKGAES